ncbi:Chemotaxis protein methyltransferase Cher2 [Thalassocella blandensis]|nr:Chemotaxis protein methyltransferase Cher2 [Thalassocella blandensis]
MVAKSSFDQMALSTVEYQEFCKFLRDSAGIDLGDNKQYLVATRLRRVMSEIECPSFSELTKLVKRSENFRLRQRVIDDMTTNETFWFRDLYPFDYLKNTAFPALYKNNPQARIRIWSAACSSGQEPYSLSMTVEECLRQNYSMRNMAVDIVATDLSSEVLQQARSGIYDQLSISRGLSPERLKSYFDDVGEGKWKAKSLIQNRISYRALNLLDGYVTLGKFDIIFCRNVLIYFSAETKREILIKLHNALRPNGLLFLGSSESLAGATDYFDMVHCNPGVLYRAKAR